MSVVLAFTVPGRPVPWQRPGGIGKRRFTPTQSKLYQAAVAWRLVAARQQAGVTQAALRKTLEAAQHFVDVAIYVPDKRTRDADNCVKNILDGVTKATGVNDTGMRMLPRVQRFEVDRDEPRVEVTIRRVVS